MNEISPGSSEDQTNLRHLKSGAIVDMLGSIASVVDGLGQAAVVTTPDGRIVHVSRAAEQAIGYSGSELSGRFLKDLLLPDKEFRLLDLQTSSPTESFTCDVVLIRKNGTAFSAAVSVSPLTDEDGYVIGTACILTGLTTAGAAEDAGYSVEDQRLLVEIGHLLSSSRDPEGDFERLAKLICRLVPFDRVSLVMSGAESDDMWELVYSRRTDESEDRATSDAGAFPKEATPEDSHSVPSVSSGGGAPAEDQISSDLFGESSPIYCPVVWESLVYRGETFGVLQLSSSMHRPYTERELWLASQLSVILSGSLGSYRLETELADSVDEMRRREEQYRLFIDQGGDALFLHDPFGNILDVND